MADSTDLNQQLLDKLVETSKTPAAPEGIKLAPEGITQVTFKQTWDDDAEQVVILHPTWPDGKPKPKDHDEHPHHGREVIAKKDAKSITLEPMMFHRNGQEGRPFNERLTYVRTAETDTHGRPIFRQGVAI